MIQSNQNGASAPPCFYFSICHRAAAIEKGGRALCRGCAARIGGSEYPLRMPSREPLYWNDRETAEALGLIEPRRGARSLRQAPRRIPF